MMFPTDFKEVNSNNEHGDMPCCVVEDGSISCWRMSFSERIKALFTGKVWVHVLGEYIPPIAMGVKCPFISYRVVMREDADQQITHGIQFQQQEDTTNE